MTDGRQMNQRIAVTQATKDRVNAFRNGAGLTYDDALNLMLDVLTGDGTQDESVVAATLNYARKTGKTISIPQIVE